MTTVDELGAIRAYESERIAQVLRDRPRGTMPQADSKLMIIAADHPARGALAAGADPLAMADRSELLARCVEALSRPGVHGFLGPRTWSRIWRCSVRSTASSSTAR